MILGEKSLYFCGRGGSASGVCTAAVGRSEGREGGSEQEGWRKKVSARASVFLWLKIEKEEPGAAERNGGEMKQSTEHDF